MNMQHHSHHEPPWLGHGVPGILPCPCTCGPPSKRRILVLCCLPCPAWCVAMRANSGLRGVILNMQHIARTMGHLNWLHGPWGTSASYKNQGPGPHPRLHHGAPHAPTKVTHGACDAAYSRSHPLDPNWHAWQHTKLGMAIKQQAPKSAFTPKLNTSRATPAPKSIEPAVFRIVRPMAASQVAQGPNNLGKSVGWSDSKK